MIRLFANAECACSFGGLSMQQAGARRLDARAAHLLEWIRARIDEPATDRGPWSIHPRIEVALAELGQLEADGVADREAEGFELADVDLEVEGLPVELVGEL